MTLVIRRSGIIQRVDHRTSVTSFWTSRFFALSIIHHDHVHLSADFTEMLLTHRSRDRQTLRLSLHIHDHLDVGLEVDEDTFLPVDFLRQVATTDITFFPSTGLPFFPSNALVGHDGKVLVARVVRTTHDAHTDTYLELGFVLVLVLVNVLSESLSCPSP